MGIARAVAKSKAQAIQQLCSGGGNEEEPGDASFHRTMSFTIPRASLDASLSGSDARDDVSFTLDADALAGLWVPVTPLAQSSLTSDHCVFYLFFRLGPCIVPCHRLFDACAGHVKGSPFPITHGLGCPPHSSLCIVDIIDLPNTPLNQNNRPTAACLRAG
jgi:hypothetical protein